MSENGKIEPGPIVLVEPVQPFVKHEKWKFTLLFESGNFAEVTSDAPSAAALWEELVSENAAVVKFPEASVRPQRVEAVIAGWAEEDEDDDGEEDEEPEPVIPTKRHRKW